MAAAAPPSPAPAPGQMSHLRLHVEALSAQLRLAQAKELSDERLMEELQRDNARLQQLADSACEVCACTCVCAVVLG